MKEKPRRGRGEGGYGTCPRRAPWTNKEEGEREAEGRVKERPRGGRGDVPAQGAHRGQTKRRVKERPRGGCGCCEREAKIGHGEGVVVVIQRPRRGRGDVPAEGAHRGQAVQRLAADRQVEWGFGCE